MDAIISYPFLGLTCGPCEINFGNTVMVQRENGEWWLGYVQDIDEDLMFVNFDSTMAPAAWIHSRHIRAQRFLSDDMGYTIDKAVRTNGSYAVQVALRNIENGPHVFRLPRLLTPTTGFGLFFAQLEHETTPRRLVVHQWQIAVAIDPAFDAPPRFNQTSGLYYRKFTVPVKNARLITMLDWKTIRKCLYKAGETPSTDPAGGFSPGNSYVGLRVHVAVNGDALSFMCAQLHHDHVNTRAEWNLETLTQACAKFYHVPDPPVLDDIMVGISQQELTVGNDGWIADMAHSIMADVLLSLDLHTQAKTKRVCTLWHQLLSDRRSSRHLIIDSSILQPRNLSYFMLSCHNLYKFSWALDMALTTDTKSLTLLDDLQFTNLTVVKKTLVTLLTIRDIQLDYIVIKNGFSFDGVTINPDMYFLPEPVGQHMDRLWKCSILTTLSTVCRHLVLRNFTVRDFTHYMKSRFMYSEFPRDRVPLHCRREMPLTIPYLILHSSDGDGGIFRKFLLAAEMNHPPIGATVYDSVRSIHRRWVDNLAYPNEWRAIRHLLQLYCGFLLDGSDRGWVDVDLRQVDVSTLTKVAVAAIHLIFAVA